MPYKDPERKRQWEREHREHRNAGRRVRRLNARSVHQSVSKPAPDPVSVKNRKTHGKQFLAIGIGVVLFSTHQGRLRVYDSSRRRRDRRYSCDNLLKFGITFPLRGSDHDAPAGRGRSLGDFGSGRCSSAGKSLKRRTSWVAPF
jgi:hypothetical protein